MFSTLSGRQQTHNSDSRSTVSAFNCTQPPRNGQPPTPTPPHLPTTTPAEKGRRRGGGEEREGGLSCTRLRGRASSLPASSPHEDTGTVDQRAVIKNTPREVAAGRLVRRGLRSLSRVPILNTELSYRVPSLAA